MSRPLLTARQRRVAFLQDGLQAGQPVRIGRYRVVLVKADHRLSVGREINRLHSALTDHVREVGEPSPVFQCGGQGVHGAPCFCANLGLPAMMPREATACNGADPRAYVRAEVDKLARASVGTTALTESLRVRPRCENVAVALHLACFGLIDRSVGRTLAPKRYPANSALSAAHDTDRTSYGASRPDILVKRRPRDTDRLADFVN